MKAKVEMADKVNITGYFDDIFEGSQKPSLCLDCSFLDDDDDKEHVNKVTIDYDDDDKDDLHEYTVRKFSTCSTGRKVVDEGQERRSSLSRDTDHPPQFCTAVLGCSSVGKTSLCQQLTTSSCVNTYEVQEMVKMETQLGVEVDGWQSRLVGWIDLSVHLSFLLLLLLNLVQAFTWPLLTLTLRSSSLSLLSPLIAYPGS